MNNSIYEIEVTDRKSFIEFVDLLLQDFYKHRDKWENDRLETFLEAMSAYTNVLHNYYKNAKINLDADVASWRGFADILIGAKIYE